MTARISLATQVGGRNRLLPLKTLAVIDHYPGWTFADDLKNAQSELSDEELEGGALAEGMTMQVKTSIPGTIDCSKY